MPGTNFYNALAMANKNTERLKQEKLAAINAASGALAKERMSAEDRKQRMAELDRNEFLQREQMALQADTRDKQFANALKIAEIGAGTRRDIAEESNLTRKELEGLKTQRATTVEGLRGGNRIETERMRQAGAGERLGQSLGVKQEMGELEREHQKAMQERGIKSRETIAEEDRISRELMAEAAREQRAKADEALQNWRNAKLEADREQGDMKMLLQQEAQRWKQVYQQTMGELKINEGLMSTPEQKDEMRSRLQPGAPQSFTKPVARGMNSAVPSPMEDPEMTLPTDEAEVEPLARSMALPSVPSKTTGVLESDRNPAPPAPVQAPAAQPSSSATPDLSSLESRVARVRQIAQELRKADKSEGMTVEQIIQKDQAGEYDRLAREQFNAEGFKTAQSKVNRVTGKPEAGELENVQDEAMYQHYGINPTLGKAAALPGELVSGFVTTVADQLASGIDTGINSGVEGAKSLGQSVVGSMPLISERTRADLLSQIASTRGTNLSSLTNQPTVSQADNAAIGQGAASVVELALPGVGKMASKIPGANYVMRNIVQPIVDAAKPYASAAMNVLRRPLSDLSGSKAAAQAAKRLAARQAAEAQLGQTANRGMADALAGEQSALSEGAQAYDDMYYEAYGRPVMQEKVMPEPDLNFQLSMPEPVKPVGVDQFGVKELPIDIPTQGPKTIPLRASEMPGYSPPQDVPLDMASAMSETGRVSMTGSKADDIARAAQLYKNPVNYPDPMAYDSVTPFPATQTPAFTESFAKELGALPTPSKAPTKPIDFGMGNKPRATMPSEEEMLRLQAQRRAVMGEQVRGADEMELQRALSETYVPPDVPIGDMLPGRAWNEKDISSAFESGPFGSNQANILMPSAAKAEAVKVGIPPERLFELVNETPIDMLPKGVDWSTPEGAQAIVEAVKRWQRIKPSALE